jgi:hypothetical protein
LRIELDRGGGALLGVGGVAPRGFVPVLHRGAGLADALLLLAGGAGDPADELVERAKLGLDFFAALTEAKEESASAPRLRRRRKAGHEAMTPASAGTCGVCRFENGEEDGR